MIPQMISPTCCATSSPRSAARCFATAITVPGDRGQRARQLGLHLRPFRRARDWGCDGSAVATCSPRCITLAAYVVAIRSRPAAAALPPFSAAGGAAEWQRLREILQHRHADRADHDRRGRAVLRRGVPDGADRPGRARRAYRRAAGRRAGVPGPVRHRPGRDDPGRLSLRRAATRRRSPRPARAALGLVRSAYMVVPAASMLLAPLPCCGSISIRRCRRQCRDGRLSRCSTWRSPPRSSCSTALQAVLAGALRGLQDTRMPMVIALLGYWLVGFAHLASGSASSPRWPEAGCGSAWRSGWSWSRRCSAGAGARRDGAAGCCLTEAR